jgi:TIR domain
MSNRDVFISYTTVDEAWAEWVAETLETHKVSVALQSWDSLPGTNFVTWINHQLAQAKFVMPLYSEQYFASDWCIKEWTSALALASLLPVRITPCTVPPVLSPIVYVDLFGVDAKIARSRLCRAVGVEQSPRFARRGFPGGGSDWRPPRSGAWAQIAAIEAIAHHVPHGHDDGDDDDDDF